MNFTDSITINGTVNLLSALIAAGFQGDARITYEGRIYNASAAVIAYLHFTNSGGYAPGVKQVETAVVVGTITTAGNSTWTVTAAGMTGSPVAVTVPLALGDTPYVIAAKAAAGLDANANVNAWFDVEASDNNVILTARTPAANDGTMNLAYADDTSVGLTDDAASNNTTAGSLSTTNGFPLETAAGFDSTYILPAGTDLSTVWIHTPSSIAIKVVIQG